MTNSRMTNGYMLLDHSLFVIWSFQRVNHQPAEKLRIKVRALCRHALALAADAADMIYRGRHHKSGQLEASAGAGLARSISAGLIALPQTVNDFLDVADVFGRRQVWCVEKRINHQAM